MKNFVTIHIHYLYVSSGNFDFALPGQIQDYKNLMRIEPRLSEGVNTSFDIYPMRYHSIGSWHLALYNFLQKNFLKLFWPFSGSTALVIRYLSGSNCM